jgi:DNA-binding IclR family transcriptional regulator
MEGSAVERQGNSGAAMSTTRAVTRALQLLEVVAHSQGERLSDLARATGVPTSTALRLLRTLENAAFVRRDELGGYHAGPGLLSMAAAVDDLPIIRVAEPHMRSLVGELGETVNLAVVDENGDALYLNQVQSPHAVRYASWRGRRVPGRVSAIGLALHGRAGRDGYVMRKDAVDAGVTAVAAPVLGPSGAIVAALGVTGPSFRFGDAAAIAAGAAVARAAAALSAELGARA